MINNGHKPRFNEPNQPTSKLHNASHCQPFRRREQRGYRRGHWQSFLVSARESKACTGHLKRKRSATRDVLLSRGLAHRLLVWKKPHYSCGLIPSSMKDRYVYWWWNSRHDPSHLGNCLFDQASLSLKVDGRCRPSLVDALPVRLISSILNCIER